MSTPRVTVLMPVFNGERFLRPAIESVLRQTARDFELLLIDDGSTDDSLPIAGNLADPRLRILRNGSNLGLVPTLNRGIEEARAPLIARADADDLNHPARLDRQLHALDESAAAVVGSDVFLIGEEGRYRGKWRAPRTHGALAWDLGFRCCFAHGSVTFRADVVREAGGYHASPRSEDWDLWSRLAIAGHRLASLPAALVKYRQHPGSITSEGQANDHFDTLTKIRQRHLAWLLESDEADPRIATLTEPWETGEIPPNYFTTRNAIIRNLPPDPDLARTLADEDYMIFFRLLRASPARAVAFVRAMASASSASRWYFPWARAIALLVLSVIRKP